MKTIAAIVFACLLATPVLADKPDPSPEKAPATRSDPSSETKEVRLAKCLTDKGLTEITDVKEYEAIRYTTPDRFYLGSKPWFSAGTSREKAGACLEKIGGHLNN